MKKTLGIYTNTNRHWVGNGFPVRSLFSYSEFGRDLSPFLLLDYAGSARFEGDGQKRGVGSHPHRGFETVTIVYSGEVSHRDSTGNGGKISSGDVQWMTAGSGILHEEFHSEDFSNSGGMLEMFQLWVNLPAKEKMVPPRYQSILSSEIPTVHFSDNSAKARIIAGSLNDKIGPARTFSPIDVWDVTIHPGKKIEFPIHSGWNAAFVIRKGSIIVNETERVGESQFILFSREDQNVILESLEETSLLFLSGETILEQLVGYGPFVMNTSEEINQAIIDINLRKFGSI